MDHDARSFNRKIKRYSRIAERAVSLGVPLEDILAETGRFHGRDFAELVRSRLSLLS